MKKITRRSFLTACGTVAAAAALTACGGSSSSSTAASSIAAASSEAVDNDANAGDPVYGGVLKYACHNSVANCGYTPELTNNAALVVLNTAYESLIDYNEDGTFKPELATEWSTDPDEPSITWTLQSGVTFTDGTAFNADAVKRNIEEYQINQRNEVANIASCEIIDDTHIKMILKSWNSSTLEGVGFFVYYMSPAALEDVDSLRSTSCGTGPFKVTEYNPGVSIKYTKNENYWQDGKPYLDGVEYYIVDEPTTRASAFQAGEYDIIKMDNLTVASQIKEMGSTSFGKIIHETNKSGQGLTGTGLIPNSADPNSPFADSRVRLAMAEAIDADALCQAFGYGMLISTNQWAAPGAITYNTDMNAIHYDVDHAKQLLSEAGYPNGFDTTMTVNAGNKDIFTAAANMLDEVGIHCTIDLVDDSTQTSLYSTGTWEGIMGHYHAISPDLGLYMGRHLDVDGAFYAKGIQHPQDAMDLLEEIRTAKTDADKVDCEWKMQELIYNHENGTALFGRPLFIQNQPIFKYDYVHGDNTSVCHMASWDIGNCWMSK